MNGTLKVYTGNKRETEGLSQLQRINKKEFADLFALLQFLYLVSMQAYLVIKYLLLYNLLT